MYSSVILTLSDGRRDAVNADVVLGQLTRWIAGRANVYVKILELDIDRIVVAYEYDMSDAFGISPHGHNLEDERPCHNWTYTVERHRGDDHNGVLNIAMTIHALCVTFPDICSDEVAHQVAETVANSNVVSLGALRSALEYYGSPSCWDGERLVSPRDGARPWTPAYDALKGRSVRPLSEAKLAAKANRPAGLLA